MKKIFFYIFIFLILVNCNSTTIEPPTTLKIPLTAEPDTLNPITASDTYARMINSRVFDSLIERDPDTLEFKPELAHRWEISSNHLQYTFYLRNDVKWHDGKKFTADDVVFSFERIMDDKVDAPFLRVYYADVEKVEKLDDYTVRFTYKKPYFLALSFCGGISIVPKHIYNDNQDFNRHEYNRKPIGMGPYIFKEWKTNKRIVLVRNENYWGQKPEIKKIIFKIISDPAVSFQVLKKGELDFTSLQPIQWVKQTTGEKFNQKFNRYKYLTPGYNYIGWNNQHFIFKDKNIRRAMTMLIDREKILEKLKYDLGRSVSGPFFIEGNQYNQNIKPILFNPKEAIKLLEKAGWIDHDNDGILDKDGKKFEFTFLFPNGSSFSERLSTILKEDLKKLGIIMNLEKMEWAAFLGKIEKKDFDATSLGWSAGFEGDPYQVWHSSQAEIARGSNFISYKNKKVDELIEKARIEFNEEKRNKIYHEIHRLINDDQPYTFLYSSYSLAVVAKRFDNVIVHKSGLDSEEWRLKVE
jgi:peptide/nickel transport system substrate-binding protein